MNKVWDASKPVRSNIDFNRDSFLIEAQNVLLRRLKEASVHQEDKKAYHGVDS